MPAELRVVGSVTYIYIFFVPMSSQEGALLDGSPFFLDESSRRRPLSTRRNVKLITRVSGPCVLWTLAHCALHTRVGEVADSQRVYMCHLAMAWWRRREAGTMLFSVLYTGASFQLQPKYLVAKPERFQWIWPSLKRDLRSFVDFPIHHFPLSYLE